MVAEAPFVVPAASGLPPDVTGVTAPKAEAKPAASPKPKPAGPEPYYPDGLIPVVEPEAPIPVSSEGGLQKQQQRPPYQKAAFNDGLIPVDPRDAQQRQQQQNQQQQQQPGRPRPNSHDGLIPAWSEPRPAPYYAGDSGPLKPGRTGPSQHGPVSPPGPGGYGYGPPQPYAQYGPPGGQQQGQYGPPGQGRPYGSLPVSPMSQANTPMPGWQQNLPPQGFPHPTPSPGSAHSSLPPQHTGPYGGYPPAQTPPVGQGPNQGPYPPPSSHSSPGSQHGPLPPQQQQHHQQQYQQQLQHQQQHQRQQHQQQPPQYNGSDLVLTSGPPSSRMHHMPSTPALGQQQLQAAPPQHYPTPGPSPSPTPMPLGMPPPVMHHPLPQHPPSAPPMASYAPMTPAGGFVSPISPPPPLPPRPATAGGHVSSHHPMHHPGMPPPVPQIPTHYQQPPMQPAYAPPQQPMYAQPYGPPQSFDGPPSLSSSAGGSTASRLFSRVGARRLFEKTNYAIEQAIAPLGAYIGGPDPAYGQHHQQTGGPNYPMHPVQGGYAPQGYPAPHQQHQQQQMWPPQQQGPPPAMQTGYAGPGAHYAPPATGGYAQHQQHQQHQQQRPVGVGYRDGPGDGQGAFGPNFTGQMGAALPQMATARGLDNNGGAGGAGPEEQMPHQQHQQHQQQGPPPPQQSGVLVEDHAAAAGAAGRAVEYYGGGDDMAKAPVPVPTQHHDAPPSGPKAVEAGLVPQPLGGGVQGPAVVQ